MKNFLFAISFLFVVSSLVVFAEMNISDSDKDQITNKINLFVESVNKGNFQELESLISSDKPNLLNENQNIIRGGLRYKFYYSPIDKNMEIINEKTIRIKGVFESSGSGWSVSGLSNYFIFEKNVNNEWFIIDTDFNDKVGSDNVMNFVRNIMIITIPISLLFFIFWLKMLIDCIKRDFNDKNLWVVLMLFLNILASILYYFIIKRKDVKKKPLKFKL